MTVGKDNNRDLGARAGHVFERMAEGRTDALHPEDRAEAEAFWDWLGGFDRPEPEVEAPKPERPPWRRPAFAAIAASLLLMLGLAGYLALRPAPTLAQSYASGQAERRTIALADGSVVKLGAASRVDVAYSAGERRIRLVAGEALFDVAHNRARPFIVEVPHGEIRAVGTAFDVRLNRRDAQVTVVDGIVRIAMSPGRGDSDRKDAILKDARKGEKIRFGMRADGQANIGFISQSDNVDIDNATSWTRGTLYFEGEPLEEAIAVVNRYARDQITLDDPALAQTPIYGVFNQGDTTPLRKLIAEMKADR